MTETLYSPLHERHVALGAKFSEFGGWLMPLQYSGVVAEHRAVRSAVGIFDVSHLGKLRIVGEGAAAFVNTCITNDLTRIGPGQAQYTLLCNEAGGVTDDLISYLISPSEVFLIPNASNTTKVGQLLAVSAPAGVSVRNEHRDHAVLAVQGSSSDEVLAGLGLPVDLVFELDHRGQRVPDPVADPHQAALRARDRAAAAGRVAAASIAAMRRLLAAMKSSASSMAAPARSAALPAATARRASSASADSAS